MKDGKDMKGAERRKPEAVRRRPLRKTENGLRHGILRAAGRSGQSGLSYFSSKTAEPLMSADEAPTSASNAPFSATHSPFVSS